MPSRRAHTGLLAAACLFAFVLGPSPARADDAWRRGPTEPLYLAIGARAGGGPLWAQSLTGAGSFLASGRVAVSFGDYGAGLVLRGGVDVLAAKLDDYTPAGTYPHADVWLALFGMGTTRRFFERGAYVGVGIGAMFGTLGYGVTLHHPIVPLAEGLYLGADITCTGQIIGSCGSCPFCGCHQPNFNLQVGVELAGFD